VGEYAAYSVRMSWPFRGIWQASLLLTLPDLSTASRERLERAARRQALAVHTEHRLYPEVVNPELINAALVEAMLRAAAS
jgi:hypothetical protein